MAENDQSLQEQARNALLKSITHSAATQTAHAALRDLAEAYALVTRGKGGDDAGSDVYY